MNRSAFSLAFLALTIAVAPFPGIPLTAANADDADVKQINKELDAVGSKNSAELKPR